MTEKDLESGELICQLVSFLRHTLDQIPAYAGRDFCILIDGEQMLDVGTTCSPEGLMALVAKVSEVEITADESFYVEVVNGEVQKRVVN